MTKYNYTVESFEYLPNWAVCKSVENFETYEEAKEYEDRMSKHSYELLNKGLIKDYRYVIRHCYIF